MYEATFKVKMPGNNVVDATLRINKDNYADAFLFAMMTAKKMAVNTDGFVEGTSKYLPEGIIVKEVTS